MKLLALPLTVAVAFSSGAFSDTSTEQCVWRKVWSERKASGDFEDFWQRSVHDGVVVLPQSEPRKENAKKVDPKVAVAEVIEATKH